VSRNEVLADLRRELPVDIVLLNLHGAMVAQDYPDCERDLLGEVRKLVGPGTIIGVELDLHTNMTESKIRDADIVVLYKEYPHSDVNARAREVFELSVKAKLGQINPKMALFDCRMVGFYPTSRAPLRQFVDAMAAAEGQGGFFLFPSRTDFSLPT